MPFSPRQRRRERPLWATPVDALQQHRQLCRRQRHRARRGHRPDEPTPVEPLGEQAQALPIEPQQLDQMTPLAPEREQRARVRVLGQHLLHQYRQAIEPFAHVGDATRQEHPRRQRRGAQRSTDNTRASAPASTDPSTLTRTPPGNSMQMRPDVDVAGCGAGAATSATRTSANAGSAGATPPSLPSRACLRHV